ncbi:MAG: hypothetical protein RBT11_14200 [Desulfobacterales bacterium]|jgi:hypothetical protein|nr:hypothetical protein [Desulfobacterales bacterium]
MHDQNRIIYPYMEVDGKWSLSDEQVMGLHDRIVREGNEEIFLDGTLDTRRKFLVDMQAHSWLYVLILGDMVAGIFWLNRFEGKTARLHHCGFNGPTYREKIDFAKRTIKTMLMVKNHDGGYALDVLIGHTPARLKRARRFAIAAGGTQLGEVPGLIWNSRTGQSENGFISYFTRNADENL